MTTKEKVIQAVQGLQDDASIEDAMEKLLFMAKIEMGLRQADEGKTISHDELKDRVAKKWLK